MTDVIPTLKVIDDLCYCSRQPYELNHARIHALIEGDFNNIDVSARDPFVLFHHAYLDMIWENFRQARQTRQERETLYSAKICGGEFPSFVA